MNDDDEPFDGIPQWLILEIGILLVVVAASILYHTNFKNNKLTHPDESKQVEPK